jgi:hypothetical protein
MKYCVCAAYLVLTAVGDLYESRRPISSILYLHCLFESIYDYSTEHFYFNLLQQDLHFKNHVRRQIGLYGLSCSVFESRGHDWIVCLVTSSV